jgi:hypothetical protein
MKWKTAPIIKVYEALGSIADGRIELDGNSAKVYSSSRNKYYDVVYEPNQNAIAVNDNGSFWVGYLGYPGITFLLVKGIIGYEPGLADYLKGFAWKDINQSFKNDFNKTQSYIDQQITEKYHINIEDFHESLRAILKGVDDLELNKLPSAKRPPSAY